MMIKLPSNVTVHAGGREWRGENPPAFFPVKRLPKPTPPPTNPVKRARKSRKKHA